MDESILHQTIAAAALIPGEEVLEIGPGIGILTRELLHAGAHVTAVEFDQRFISLLQNFCQYSPQLTAMQGNALHAPLTLDRPYKIVANIPYHITSPLLHRFFLEVPRLPTSLTLLIQKEVAQTICAPTTESILSLLVQLFGRPEIICTVPPSCFLPPPKVDSAVLHISHVKAPFEDLSRVHSILKLAKHAMSNRRKMLRNTIGSLQGGMAALKRACIDPVRRPESLTASEWILLEKELSLA
jgi:16S rRNA (adenine1518-N6/adenine1519-N6)-dimethyltransferase